MDDTQLRSMLEMNHQAGYGWALNCCSRNPADAESVLQATYLKVLQGKARFDGKSEFKTWLFAVIRRTAADQRRRRVLQRLRIIRLTEESASARQVESNETRLYRSEIQTLFEQSLATLSKRQREVLLLVFYHDLTLAEAAVVMDISLGSVRTHYERGKKQLRVWLAEMKVIDEAGMGRTENQAIIP